MVMRVVGRRVRREAPRRAVLEALIDRQDDELAGAAEPTLQQYAREIGLGARAVAFVVVQDLIHGRAQGHGGVL